jgi:hypothetical protein
MQEFDIDAFIANINQDKVVMTSKKDRLNKVLMNSKPNQGTVSLIPIFSKKLNGFYFRLPGVLEYFGDTTVIDNKDGIWYKILPIEFYGNLSEDEIDLYNEVHGLLETLRNYDEVSYDELRYRNYSIVLGICNNLINTDQKPVDTYNGAPCMFIYPSPAPINNIVDAITDRVATTNSKAWITRVISPAEGERKGVLQITFKKKPGDQPGYDSSAKFEMNNSDEGVYVVPADFKVTKEMIDKFDDPIQSFNGWMNDKDKLFNALAFKELRDQLKLRLKGLEEGEKAPEKEPEYENKNNLNEAAPKPATEEAAPVRKRPF